MKNTQHPSADFDPASAIGWPHQFFLVMACLILEGVALFWIGSYMVEHYHDVTDTDNMFAGGVISILIIAHMVHTVRFWWKTWQATRASDARKK